MRKALICGVGGQDGAYLAQLLLNKGYAVWGTSRDAQLASFVNLHRLGIRDRVQVLSMAQNDFRSVLNALVKSEPDEIYFLSAQSSVGLSFEQPVESIDSVVIGVLNLLEAVRFLNDKIRVYHASSSESFGNIAYGESADELTPFRPRSPYGVAKASAHWLVSNYREAYGLFCCSGVLFNHESPMRPSRFVTRKIVSTACRIASGSTERLRLGKLNISRDWGWAEDYVVAMWRMLQRGSPEDYVIASGESHTLEAFVTEVFRQLGLDWREYVDIDDSLFRPSEIEYSRGNPTKAKNALNWANSLSMSEIITRLLASERSLMSGQI